MTRTVRHALPVVLAALCIWWTAPSAAQNPTPPDRLRFLGSAPVHDRDAGLAEPSGLALDPGTNSLWTVSDDSETLFRLTKAGKLRDSGPRIDRLRDPEGIALDHTGQRLLVLSEADAAIMATDLDNPQAVRAYPLFGMAGTDLLTRALEGKTGDLSPEGIAVNADTGAVLVVNERAPRLLIEISSDLDRIVAVQPLSQNLGFLASGVTDHQLDASGLAYDAQRKGLWISSDTGKCLFFWEGPDSPARRFDLLWQEDDKVRPIDNAEGVALSADGETLYLISDDGKKSRFFEFAVE